MMRQEWLEFIGKKDIEPRQWENVDLVYTWHPAVPESRDGARAYCRDLFDRFGYGIFEVMAPDAQKIVDIEHEHAKLTKLEAGYTELYHEERKRLEEGFAAERARIATEHHKLQLQYDELKARFR